MAWGEEEKNKIQLISHERLLFDCNKSIKESLPMAIFTITVCFVVGLIVCLLAIGGSSDFLGSFADDGFLYVLKLPAVIFGVLFCFWPFAISAWDILDDLVLWSRIQHKKYTVIDDVLLASSPSEVYPESIWQRLRAPRRRYEVPHHPTFYFSKAGRHPVGSGMYQFAELGDRYYIVMLNGKKQKIFGIYSQKIYRWEGDPTPLRAEL